MKNFTLYLLLLLTFVINSTINAQEVIQGLLWVTVNDESARPVTNTNRTSNATINQVFEDYNVTFYQPAFPNAQNDLLLNTYEVRFTGNTDNLYALLSTSFTDQFSNFKIHYQYDNIAVYDPIDYMWVAHADDWLWHLKRIQADLAWDITKGNPDVTIAIIDTDVDSDHPDLTTELKLPYEPYSGTEFDCDPFHGHGTTVASFATAETTEQGGVANGQLASVGFNTKFIFYYAWAGNYLQRAHHASLVMDADVLTSSAGGWRCSGNPDPIEEAVVKEILDHGTVIVMPAGNGVNGTHCDNGNDGILDPWYPLHPIYDDRIIIVTSTDFDDNHGKIVSGVDYTHSHFESVDICSPGYDVFGASSTECGNNTWPYYGSYGGTSFATPIVAGVCALLKSIDINFTPGEIQEFIKNTADPVTDGNDYPGQIGTGRVNAFKAVEMALNCLPIIVNSDETWTDDKIIVCGVEIKNGATLSILSEVKLSKNSEIIIETGAKLIVDGGTLTNLDNQPWQGIQVWGNINEHQFEYPGHPCAQGKLILNNAVIENAWDAVKLWKPGDYNSTGGIIIARNSWFKNNKRAVEFMSYQNFSPGTGEPTGYGSSFTNCDFIVDDDYAIPSGFYTHISMWDVYNISIRGCRFSNQISDAQNIGFGILSASAGYRLTNLCTATVYPCPEANLEHNTFSNFYAGIQAYNNFASVNTVYVNDAVFSNNSYGIKLNAIDNATVINSEFNIAINKRDEIFCENREKSASGTGIELTGCTGFAIEENSFNSENTPFGGYKVGVSIAQTNAPYDEVYLNQYNNLSMANYTKGKNWSLNEEWNGLAFYCNQNTGNWADVYVTKGEGSVGGVQSQQGDLNNSAGNEFTATDAEWHFYNGGDHNVDYYYCTSCPGQEPELTEYVTTHAISNINDCPSHYGGGGDEIKIATSLTNDELLLLEQEYAANLTSYNNVQALYENLKDGGDTEALVEEVETSWPNDMWELRAELLGDSPHLSMEVLKQAADKTDVLPESVQFEILAANPDELKKKELINHLENKEEPMPQYMIDILKEVANGTTYKTVLLRQMSEYNQQKMRAAYDIIRSKVHDTLTDMEGLRNWLDNVGGIQADEQIIATYLQQGNSTDALALAQLMPQLYKLKGEELKEHGFYTDMLNLHIDLKQDNRNIFMLESDEMELLEYLADSSYGTAGIQARGLLEFAYGHHFPDCIECDDESGFKNSAAIGKDFNKLFGIDISVQPNPAKGWAEFSYTLPDESSEGILHIYDVPGRLVESIAVQGRQGQKLWDTRKLKSGIYIYKLDALGTSKTGKIVVQH